MNINMKRPVVQKDVKIYKRDTNIGRNFSTSNTTLSSSNN